MKLFLLLFASVLWIGGSRTHAMPWRGYLQEMLPTVDHDATSLLKDLGISIRKQNSDQSERFIATIKNATSLLPFIGSDEVEIKLEVITGYTKFISRLSFQDLIAGKELGEIKLIYVMEKDEWELTIDLGEIDEADKPGMQVQVNGEDHKLQLEANMSNGYGDRFKFSCKSIHEFDVDFKMSSMLMYNEHKYNLVGRYTDEYGESELDYSLKGDGLLVQGVWNSNFEDWLSEGKLTIKAGGLDYNLNIKADYDYNNAVISLAEGNHDIGEGKLEYDFYGMMYKLSGNYKKNGEKCSYTLESQPGMTNINFTEVCNGVKDWEYYVNFILDTPTGKDVETVDFGLRNRKGEVLTGRVTNKVPMLLLAEIEMPNILGKKYSATFGFSLMGEWISAVVQKDNVKYGVEVTKFFFFSSEFDAAFYLGDLGTLDVSLTSSALRHNPSKPDSFEFGAEVLYNQASVCHLNVTETFGWARSQVAFDHIPKTEGVIGLHLKVLDSFSFMANAKAERQIGTFGMELKVMDTRYTADGSLGLEAITVTLEAENKNGISYGSNPIRSCKIDISSGIDNKYNVLTRVDVSYTLLSGDQTIYTSQCKKYVGIDAIEFTVVMDQVIDIKLDLSIINNYLKCTGGGTIFGAEYGIESLIHLDFPLDKNEVQYVEITKDDAKFASIKLFGLSMNELLIKYDVKGIRSGEVAVNANKSALTVQDSPDQGPGWTFQVTFRGQFKDADYGYELKIGDKVDSSYSQSIVTNREGRFDKITQTTKWFIANSSNLYPLTCFEKCFNSFVTKVVVNTERATELADVSYQELMDGILHTKFYSKILSDPLDFFVQFPLEVAQVLNTRSLRLEVDKAVLGTSSILMMMESAGV